MTGYRQRLDHGFASLARSIVRRPWIALLTALVPVVLLAAQIPSVRFDTSTEGFLRADDPAMLDYEAFRGQFGRDELVLLALSPPRIFDFAFLERLRALHERLEEDVPHLEEVTSLINARATRGDEGELIVEELMEEWPESAEALERISSFALANPSYRNVLLSEDGRFTTVAIRTVSSSGLAEIDPLEAGFDDEDGSFEEAAGFLTDEENSEVVAAVAAIVEEFRSDDFPILMAGSPVVTDSVKGSMQRDMLRFIRLTILAVAVFLFALFRRVSAVVLPIVVVVLSLVSTIGLMAATGTALKLPTMILPSFLLAVGVGDSVHVLALFFRRLEHGASREECMVYALEHSGLPIVLTSLTTAGGLLSFAASAVAPIGDLGTFAPAGVMIALFLSLTLLPALLAIVPIRPARSAHSDEAEADGGGRLDAVLAKIGDFATGRPWPIVSVSGLLAVVALVGASRIQVTHNPLEWLPESSPVRIATHTIDSAMRGSITLEVVLRGEAENTWYSVELLNQLEAVSRFAEEFSDGEIFIGRAFSLVDVLKEIHRALNENRPEYYVVPDERALIAQEFLLFENSGSDDLEDLVDPQFSQVRLTLKAPFVDAVAYSRTLATLEETLDQSFDDDIEIVLTGLMPLLFRTMSIVVESMIRSYLLAFVVITVLMMLLIGSVRLGLVAMVPNLLPIVLVLGLMGFLDLPLDMFTLLIGSIALGLSVDDTIHFMHNYRRYYAETGSSREASHRTLQTAGRAMLLTSLVLSTGFFIFTLSEMNNIFNFGLLTGLAIMLALVADFLLAPALMQLIHPEIRGSKNGPGT
jgi:hypothetical protein